MKSLLPVFLDHTTNPTRKVRVQEGLRRHQSGRSGECANCTCAVMDNQDLLETGTCPPSN